MRRKWSKGAVVPQIRQGVQKSLAKTEMTLSILGFGQIQHEQEEEARLSVNAVGIQKELLSF